jgi:hypothetical protein
MDNCPICQKPADSTFLGDMITVGGVRNPAAAAG